MALLTAIRATAAGVVVTPTPVTTSDTISQADLGTRGANLIVRTSGTVTNVSVADPNTTPSGNPGTVTPIAMAATQNRAIFIPPSAVNPATGLATVTYSSATGVTCELYPL